MSNALKSPDAEGAYIIQQTEAGRGTLLTIECRVTGRKIEHVIRPNAVSFNRQGLIEAMKRTLEGNRK